MNGRPKVKRAPGSWLAFMIGLWLIVSSSQLQAQTDSSGSIVSVSGRVTAAKAEDVTVETPSGAVVIKFVDKTVIRGEIPIMFSEITSGMYVGATAAKQSDGTFRASRLHVFSEDQRGTGEGHRPLSSAPQSGLTMTNANVEHVEDVAVENVKGRLLTLKYTGGGIKVLVPPGIPTVKRVVGDPSLLKPGATVSVQATRGADGSLSASQITVRASGT